MRRGVVMVGLLSAVACREIADPVPTASSSLQPVLTSRADAVGGISVLGSLGGFCRPSAINDIGTVVGFSFTASNQPHAFIFTSIAGMRDLGTLGGSFATAADVNDRDEVVGSAGDRSDRTTAFFADARGMIPIAGPNSDARRINNSGQVVGRFSTSSGNRAFLWTRAGGLLDLGTLPGMTSSLAEGINERGHVIGTSGNDFTGERKGFFWDGSTMIDLGANAVPTAINENDQVVGTASFPGFSQHAFIWDPSGGMRDLGTINGPQSAAVDINESGQVVGYSIAGTSSDPFQIPIHAFLWSPGTGMVDLGTYAGANTSNPIALADNGQIIGRSNNGAVIAWNGAPGAFALPDLGGGGEPNAIRSAGLEAAGSAASSSGNLCVKWKIPNTPPNANPVAVAGGPYTAILGEAVTFDGSASADPDHDALTFDWAFGDGASAGNAGTAPSHTYAAAGDYTASLTVMDGKGGRHTADASVTILSPAGATQALGDLVGSLAAGGEIPPALAGPLGASINSVLASLASGNTGSATGQLGAFLNKVKAALKTGKIDGETAASLTDLGQRVLDGISP